MTVSTGVGTVASVFFTLLFATGMTVQASEQPCAQEEIVISATESARTDLAARLQVAVEAIEVLGEYEVTWPNGGLGCPRPEMSYKQVLVPGQQLLLSAGGKRYYYHRGTGAYRFCAQPESRFLRP